MPAPGSVPAVVRRTPTPEPEPLDVVADFMVFVARSALSQRQRQRLDAAAASPVTGAELNALRAVRRPDPVTMTALAERLGLDRTTVSRLVARLEELELVTRTTDAADRRKTWVSVAPSGQELLDRFDRVSMQDFRVATASWSPADRQALATLLSRLQHDLERLEFDDRGWAVGQRPDDRADVEAS
jgi:DNA-binding MarR family transcriptional regulator